MRLLDKASCGVTLLLVFFASLLTATNASAQDLSQRVLIVYAQGLTDSENVAHFYADQRHIPIANLCAIDPPSNWLLTESDYDAFVKAPIQQCLAAVGPEKILYIVFTYGTPYLIDRPHGPYSLDSYVADIWGFYPEIYAPIGPPATHGYYTESQSEGGFFPPFLSLSDYRQQPGSDLIYSVWRLDGPSPEIATGLVSQAMQTEGAGGPSGQACFDRNRGDMSFPDFGYTSGEWDLHRAAEFAASAGYPVLEDANQEEFGTAPAANCSNAVLYSGWYSFNNYNDAFTWATGAIGWHLDSASARDPRGGLNWAAQALRRGITVTTGAVNEPFLEGMVRPAGVIRNLLEGANVGDAFLHNARWLKWMILNIGDPLYTPFAGGRPPFNTPTAVASLEIEPRAVVGGQSTALGIIHLSNPAPPDGVTFQLTSSDAGSIRLPETLTVPEGSTTGIFPIETLATTGLNATVITAQSASTFLQNTVATAPLLGALFFEPDTASPAQIGTVYLNDVAPADIVITLTSDNPQQASVPDSLYVAAGTTSASFAISISPGDIFATANITAAYAGATVTQQLAIPATPQATTARSPTRKQPARANTRWSATGRTPLGPQLLN